MPTEGPAQCLSQRLSLRLQYCLQESCCNSLCRGSMWHQRTARPLAAQVGTHLKHPGCSDGTHVFKKAHRMQFSQLEILLHLHLYNLLQVSFEFPKLQSLFAASGALQDQDPSDAPSNPRSRHPSSQPSAASRPRRRPGRGEGGRHGVRAFAVPSGPINEVLLNRPTGVVRTPEGSAAALCARAGGYKQKETVGLHRPTTLTNAL